MYFLISKDFNTGERHIVNEADDLDTARDIASLWLDGFHDSMEDSEHLLLCEVIEVDEDTRF